MKKSLIYIIAILMLLASVGTFAYQNVAFEQANQYAMQQHTRGKELTAELEKVKGTGSEIKKKIDSFEYPPELTDEEKEMNSQAEDWKKRTEELRGYVK